MFLEKLLNHFLLVDLLANLLHTHVLVFTLDLVEHPVSLLTQMLLQLRDHVSLGSCQHLFFQACSCDRLFLGSPGSRKVQVEFVYCDLACVFVRSVGLDLLEGVVEIYCLAAFVVEVFLALLLGCNSGLVV